MNWAFLEKRDAFLAFGGQPNRQVLINAQTGQVKVLVRHLSGNATCQDLGRSFDNIAGEQVVRLPMRLP